MTKRSTTTPGKSGLSIASLRHHPAPRYLVTGSITFLIDIGSLKILHGSLGISLALATVLAFFVAFVFNFTISRQWTFAATAKDGHARRQIVRYLILVGVNLCSTLLLVVGLSTVGVNYLIAKIAAGCINAGGNFFAYRHWVFNAPPVL